MKKQNSFSIKAHLLRGAFFLLLLLAVCVIPFALAQRGIGKRHLAPRGSCPTPWTFIADMPIDLYGAACASNDTSIYCAGGYSISLPGVVPQLVRYDPGPNTWTALAPIPVPSSMASAVYYPPTNKIYVFGGSDPDAETVNNLNQIYDIASNTWSTGAPLPDLRSFMASGYSPDNGKIYLVGGYNTALVDSGQPDTWEYDPVADTYTNKTDFPELAGGYASGIINGHLYVAGGRDNNNVSLSTVWDYDIAADTWTQKNDMPGTQNNVRGSAVALDSLFVFGGGDPFIVPGSPASKSKLLFPVKELKATTGKAGHKLQIPLTDNGTNVYLPDTDEWRTSANMNVFRAFTSGTAIGINVYAAGGYDGTVGNTVASAEVLTACIPAPAPTCPECNFSTGTGTLVPGVTDIGNHTDDGDTFITLPFPVTLYDQTFTTAEAGSNGHLTFGTANPDFTITCSPFGLSDTTFVLAPYWGDQCTGECASVTCDGCGIFTAVTGSAPNRIFYIEWRTQYYDQTTSLLNYEIALFENGSAPQFIYANIAPAPAANDSELVVGTKRDDVCFVQFGCDPSGGQSPPVSTGQQLTLVCAAPSPTPTATATTTPSPRPTPTPRPRPTPHPRPTP